ncbi:unnamed protein product [Didymodactylos carnosus]|uniref:N-acetylglucosaminylphosphatidylinositol deacetylase n=1 Tax=Didymodactylos carnosus TaxID=1234261 RepID=A0A813SFU4_9BILA|nr:unnamed protein product [Didymodactylos carnosus]CAF1345464.1 unnamed protein product [Didymodactylos carnosus]CAF3583702.1 unnamed protein product [Didymodactylos carnosus]CAF4156312.1 unnamed protein product [Didymodactylos carnosus]
MANPLAILLVIAHPDDETLYAGFLHAMVHKLKATLDLCCVTNGEGGFRYSQPCESIYGLNLSNETIARTHLPRIRQEELQASGKILGVRKYFYISQKDLKYSRDIKSVFDEQWDKDLIIRYLCNIIRTGNSETGYDIMLVMLPNVESHGHHTASGLLALSAIDILQKNQKLDTNMKHASNKIPIVLGGSEFSLAGTNLNDTDIKAQLPENELWYKNMITQIYPQYPLTKLHKTSPIFLFHRTWKLSTNFDDNPFHPNYHLILLWMCAAHKSQGSLINETQTTLAKDIEQYFYFQLNDETNIQNIQDIFIKLKAEHNTK